MCLATYTESGKFLGMEKPCPEYEALKQERNALRTAMIWWRDKAQFRRGCIEEYEHESDWHASEIIRLRRALDLLGVPAQALKDPDKAPPLHVSVALARKAMEVINGDMAANGPSHGPA